MPVNYHFANSHKLANKSFNKSRHLKNYIPFQYHFKYSVYFCRTMVIYLRFKIHEHVQLQDEDDHYSLTKRHFTVRIGKIRYRMRVPKMRSSRFKMDFFLSAVSLCEIATPRL